VSSKVTYIIDVTFDCTSRPPIDTTPAIDTSIIDTTGIRALQAGEVFSIYPNPAGKSISIICGKSTGSMVVKMYGVLGEEVLSAGLSAVRTDIDVSDLARGMYFVELYKDGVPVSVRKLTLL
jgi:hypothetical protein